MLCRIMSKNQHQPSMDPYQMLANAIVTMAAKDYRKTLRWLMRNPRSCSAKAQLATLEAFFRSDWYSVLTNVSGEWLMDRMKEEYDYDG